MFIDFRERGRKGERKKHGLPPVAPQPGISPVIFWYTGWCSIQLSHLARAWPWHFWRVQGSYFVDCFSVWVCCYFLVIRVHVYSVGRAVGVSICLNIIEVASGHFLKWCLFGFSTVHFLLFSVISKLWGDSFETGNIRFLIKPSLD